MGVPWDSLGCLRGSLEAPLEHSGGPVEVPGALLVALGWLFVSGSLRWRLQENLGDSGSHVGSNFYNFLMIFLLFFGFVF